MLTKQMDGNKGNKPHTHTHTQTHFGSKRVKCAGHAPHDVGVLFGPALSPRLPLPALPRPRGLPAGPASMRGQHPGWRHFPCS